MLLNTNGAVTDNKTKAILHMELGKHCRDMGDMDTSFWVGTIIYSIMAFAPLIFSV